MQNASFLVLKTLFWNLYCMYMLYFFLSKASYKCQIVLYECLCFYLFVVCQNEDLKHVAGIVTRLHGENVQV